MNELVELPLPRTLDDFAAGIKRIARFHRQFRWRLGEYLVQNEDRFGEAIWQYVDELGMSHGDIANCMSVYRRIGDQYTPEIKWSLWQALAPLEPKDREPLITRALSGQVTRDEIRAIASSANGNGAASSENVSAGIPTQMEAQIERLAQAMVTVGRLLRRKSDGADCNEDLKAALEEVTAEIVMLSGML